MRNTDAIEVVAQHCNAVIIENCQIRLDDIHHGMRSAREDPPLSRNGFTIELGLDDERLAALPCKTYARRTDVVLCDMLEQQFQLLQRHFSRVRQVGKLVAVPASQIAEPGNNDDECHIVPKFVVHPIYLEISP